MSKYGIGILGCGNIAGPYARDIINYDEFELIGVADLDYERAKAFADEHNTFAFESNEAMLSDDRVDIVINLTIHHAHKEVSAAIIEAGKHVFSEKPMAMSFADAQSLVELAKAKGVRFGASPFTLMGQAPQTAWKLIRDGKIGKVHLAYAEVNWGRIETWHPAPKAFYDVGPLFDVGVYPLTILVSMFGPAKRLQSYGTILYPHRTTKHGQPFEVTSPDFNVTMLEMSDGTVVRLTSNFYVSQQTKQSGIEFHGETGSVYLHEWQRFDTRVEYAEWGKPYEPVELIGDKTSGTPWGRGVWEMVQAMEAGKPHRFTGELAAHVVEILECAQRSGKEGHAIDLTSTFPSVTPMEWAE